MPFLNENERRVRADTPAGLVPFEDDTVGPELLRPDCLGQGDRLDQHLDAGIAEPGDEGVRFAAGEDHPGRPMRSVRQQVFGQIVRVVAQFDAEAARGELPQPGDRRPHPGPIAQVFRVDAAAGTRPASGDGDGRVGRAGHGQGDEVGQLHDFSRGARLEN